MIYGLCQHWCLLGDGCTSNHIMLSTDKSCAECDQDVGRLHRTDKSDTPESEQQAWQSVRCRQIVSVLMNVGTPTGATGVGIVPGYLQAGGQ